MKSLWRIPDFLDLELFFIQDKQLEKEQGTAALRDRDRNLYLDAIEPDLDEGTEPGREWLLYRWLQERRSLENQKYDGHALLPGRMWYELYGLFWSFFSFLAMASGAGLAWSFLSYTGAQPVNVSLFFLVFVGLQVCVLLFLLLVFAYRRVRGLDLRSSLLLSLVNKGLNGFLFKIRKYGLSRMESRRRSQFAAALAAVRTRGKGYGALFSWPLFLLFQLFGIAFNCGVLGVLLVKVASSDLAFGWQSTIQLSSEFVARLVQWIAVPWSWMLGSATYPDVNQVEGSRMILKDGFYHLASSDLVSWWPFLALSICCYCLLPRMVLFAAGTFGRKKSLARISFHRPDHNQLLHRLLSPRLETSPKKIAAASPLTAPAYQEDVLQAEEGKKRIPAQKNVNGKLLALIPDELFDDVDPARLEQFCQQDFGYTVGRTLRINEEYSDNRMIFNQIKEGADLNCPALLILQEAWQPPIQEVLRFLRELRLHCDEETHIIVALVGKPDPDTLFTRVADTDLHIWQQKIATLLDPCLQLSPLVAE
ncbi:MAG TPA: DUF2868 domain-containing protein [Desulfocapsa sulfexigens]|nr:DUF2868 domain-containing protein [Desulfocapsa sulfexigens]